MDEDVLIHRLKDYWASTDTEMRPGASAEEIAAFEARHGVRLPAFMSRFYSEINGTVGMDENHIFFYAVDHLIRVPDEFDKWVTEPNRARIRQTLPDAESYFVFADFDISMLVYAIRLSDAEDASAPILWILDDEVWDSLADSFFDFFVKYLKNPERIAMP